MKLIFKLKPEIEAESKETGFVFYKYNEFDMDALNIDNRFLYLLHNSRSNESKWSFNNTGKVIFIINVIAKNISNTNTKKLADIAYLLRSNAILYEKKYINYYYVKRFIEKILIDFNVEIHHHKEYENQFFNYIQSYLKSNETYL